MTPEDTKRVFGDEPNTEAQGRIQAGLSGLYKPVIYF